MESAYLGRPLDVHWDGRQSRDFTHVADVVQANLRAAVARRGVGEAFNIANGTTHSLLDLVRVIERVLGRGLELRFHPKRKGDVRKTWADVSRARRLLGFQPSMGFEEGLRDTWRYFGKVYFGRRKA
jgi:nucleoside-diphosphate-sugar epimerase